METYYFTRIIIHQGSPQISGRDISLHPLTPPPPPQKRQKTPIEASISRSYISCLILHTSIVYHTENARNNWYPIEREGGFIRVKHRKNNMAGPGCVVMYTWKPPKNTDAHIGRRFALTPLWYPSKSLTSAPAITLENCSWSSSFSHKIFLKNKYQRPPQITPQKPTTAGEIIHEPWGGGSGSD